MARARKIKIREVQEKLRGYGIHVTEATLRNWLKRWAEKNPNLIIQPGGERSAIYVDMNQLRRELSRRKMLPKKDEQYGNTETDSNTESRQ